MSNRLINEFLSLKCAPDVLGVCGTVQNISKEISEAMGVVKRMKREIISHSRDDDYIHIYDLCAGNALGSVLLAHLFNNVIVRAHDIRARNRRWEKVRRFSYFLTDINTFMPTIIPKHSIIISIHPCTELAERVIEIYNQSLASSLYLLACCEGPIKSFPGANMIREFPNGSYMAWCMHLANQCKGRSEGRTDIKRINHCISPKNILVEAHKNQTSWSMRINS